MEYNLKKTKSLCCTPQSSTICKINYTSTITKKEALIGFTKINLFNFVKNKKIFNVNKNIPNNNHFK